MVTELQKKYEFKVELIKRTDTGLLKRLFLPKFPALEIDDQLVFEGQDISADALENEIIKRKAEQ